MARGIGNKLKGIGTALAGAVPKVAAFGSAFITAAPYIAKAGMALVHFGQAAIAAGPALIAMGAGALYVKTALTAIFKEGSAMRTVLQPLADGFNLAGENASKAAAHGLEPLVAAFKKVAWPELNHSFVQIGKTVNSVAAGFLRWGSSAEGLQTINGIVHPIWQAIDGLDEPILQVGIAFAEMLSRIMGVSMEAGEQGLAGILYKLAAAMDKVNASTVSGGIEKLKGYYHSVADAVTTVVRVLKTLIGWYKTYQQQFWYLADALAVVAIAFGGPVTAVIAAIGLVIRHWDDLKKAYGALVSFFTETPQGMGFMDALRNFADTVLPHIETQWKALSDAVGPAVHDIADKIQNEVIPALTDFINAMAPVVAFLIDVLGPYVVATFNNIVTVIKGAIDIIVGIIKVFTGILTGDWSMVWEGVKLILGGAVQVIIGLFNQILNQATTIFSLIGAAILGAIRSGISMIIQGANEIGSAIMNALSGIGNWAWNLGKSIVNGIVGGIKSLAGSVGSALKSIIPGPAQRFLGFARGGVVGMMGRVGAAASGGLRRGLTMVGERGPELAALPMGSHVYSNDDSRRMMQSGGGGGGGAQIVFGSDGSKMGDLILEFVRKSVKVRGGNAQVVLGTG